jgi:hypothetical protein
VAAAVEAEAAVHGAAAEEVPVAEVPAGAGKKHVYLTGKPVFFLCAPVLGQQWKTFQHIYFQ